MRAVVCCVLMIALMIPTVAMCCMPATVGVERRPAQQRLEVAVAVSTVDDLGFLPGFVIGYALGHLLDWYIEFIMKDGGRRLEPPSGDWWPGRI